MHTEPENPAISIGHFGNILNNGYLHCKYLRARGFRADSINIGYTHCQGQPEWVEVDLEKPVPEWNADWTKFDLQGFVRPDWYLEILPQRKNQSIFETDSALTDIMKTAMRSVYRNTRDNLVNVSKRCNLPTLRDAVIAGDQFLKTQRNFSQEEIETSRNLVSRFLTEFPDAQRPLKVPEVLNEIQGAAKHRQLLRNYTLAQGYALEANNIVLAAPSKPFIAYEHGTLRDFPFEDSTRGRLYALATKMAEKLIITNADCKFSAERLGLKNYQYLPHLVDDQVFRPRESTVRGKLLTEHNCDFILLSPARHHWKNCPPGMENSWLKRNDIMIKGLGAMFRANPKLRVLVVFFEWGPEVDLSKELIREQGFSDRVIWKQMLTKKRLSEYILAADVILDQFNDGIGTFGASAAEGLACGKPVLLNYKKEIHQWCFNPLPPLINTPCEDSVADTLTRLLNDEDYRLGVGQQGYDWYSKHHSSDVVISRLIDIYREIGCRVS